MLQDREEDENASLQVLALKSAIPRFWHFDVDCYKEKSDYRNPSRSCLSLKLDLMAGEDGAKVTVGDPITHGIRFFSPTLLLPSVEPCTSKK